ncbi:MAG: imidazole glycerol phosphate synthase subunit HisH [Candidatus Altiarchaeota archaeon]|nr:imidazole glycerol phosphate synthase subunit HisH [Candidatus Altiarchaeota archaeon]
MITVIDYGMGNIFSIRNALEKAGAEVQVVRKVEDLDNPDALVIPGVGSFERTMSNLEPFRGKILKLLGEGRPFLGICMGMQALFESSEEGAGRGFGAIRGEVIRLPEDVSVPQIGWNEVRLRMDCRLLEGVSDGDFFYFVHSYYCVPVDKKVVAATTDHGVEFASVVVRDNISGVQFHPEKSGDKGLLILNNFVRDVRC